MYVNMDYLSLVAYTYKYALWTRDDAVTKVAVFFLVYALLCL